MAGLKSVNVLKEAGRLVFKEDESIASPAVSLKCLFTKIIIHAKLNRDVAIFDVPRPYPYAYILR